MRLKYAYAKEYEKVDVPWWNIFARCYHCNKKLKGEAIKWTDLIHLIEDDEYRSHLCCMDCDGTKYKEWLKELPKRLAGADEWEATLLHYEVKAMWGD